VVPVIIASVIGFFVKSSRSKLNSESGEMTA